MHYTLVYTLCKYAGMNIIKHVFAANYYLVLTVQFFCYEIIVGNFNGGSSHIKLGL